MAKNRHSGQQRPNHRPSRLPNPIPGRQQPSVNDQLVSRGGDLTLPPEVREVIPPLNGPPQSYNVMINEGAAPGSGRVGAENNAAVDRTVAGQPMAGTTVIPHIGLRIPPIDPLPVTDRGLQTEAVSSDGLSWIIRVAKALPKYIDDLTGLLGDDVYDRMTYDAAVKASLNTLKSAILEEGVTLAPAVHDAIDERYEKAMDILTFCNECLEHMETSLDVVLWDMLRALHTGNSVAEMVYENGDIGNGPQLLLKSVKVKPRQSYAFVTDPYQNIIGIQVLIPGLAFSLMPGMVVADPRLIPNLLPRDKFAILTVRGENNDPRGQALDPETPIPTPDGWRTMEELQPGDKVFDEQGKIRYVTARKEWEDRPCYKLTFEDGSNIIADENHQWLTKRSWQRSKGQAKLWRTKEIAVTVRTADDRPNHTIQRAAPLDYPEQSLSLHPYFLGLWLGDGSAIGAQISCGNEDLEETLDNLESCGYTVTASHSGITNGNGNQISVTGNERWSRSGPRTLLREAGLFNNKHIPDLYLKSSIQQRKDLLAGLMDSDGQSDPDGRCTFSNTNKFLIDGVTELVRSLGFKAAVSKTSYPINMSTSKSSCFWRVCFYPTWTPFKLTRKSLRVKSVLNRPRHHCIIAVDSVPNRRTICIEVDSPSHLYLAGKNMVPTHNSVLRSAYQAWWNKMQAWPEYLRYLTQFGSPLIHGQVSPTSMPETVTNPDGSVTITSPTDVLLRTLEALRNGAAIATPNASTVTVVQANGNGEAFLKGFELFDKQITLAILSQTLATSEGEHNARAAAVVHQDVLKTLIRQLKRLVSRMIRNDILKPLVLYNYGEEESKHLTPIVTLGETEKASRAQMLLAYTQAGYILDPTQFHAIDDEMDLPPRGAMVDDDAIAPPGQSVDTKQIAPPSSAATRVPLPVGEVAKEKNNRLKTVQAAAGALTPAAHLSTNYAQHSRASPLQDIQNTQSLQFDGRLAHQDLERFLHVYQDWATDAQEELWDTEKVLA